MGALGLIQRAARFIKTHPEVVAAGVALTTKVAEELMAQQQRARASAGGAEPQQRPKPAPAASGAAAPGAVRPAGGLNPPLGNVCTLAGNHLEKRLYLRRLEELREDSYDRDRGTAPPRGSDSVAEAAARQAAVDMARLQTQRMQEQVIQDQVRQQVIQDQVRQQLVQDQIRQQQIAMDAALRNR
jgi:hypothetical protein